MKKIAILSGAGMSAESGISTFRDSGGLWDKYPVEQVATPQGYAANPQLVTTFYNERRKQLLEVQPNVGHQLLATLEKEYEVVVITQNVDNLHERAGSTHVVHLHGELTKVTSSLDPENPAYIRSLEPEVWEVKMGDLAEDGSQLRPFIVWFGEAVPKMEEAIDALKGVDYFVIIGTSMNVYPAAGLINYVPPTAKVFLIDPNEVQVTNSRPITVIQEGASEGVANLINYLQSNSNSPQYY
ncbi:MAG: SIR2 family NAD-dependent protein deacylase [Phocaeicola sp.]